MPAGRPHSCPIGCAKTLVYYPFRRVPAVFMGAGSDEPSPVRRTHGGWMAPLRWLTVVGIGEGGQERIVWPSPFDAAFEMLLARRGTPVCVLASGDPMWFGIGASLSRLLP